jgi:hypothetical protein
MNSWSLAVADYVNQQGLRFCGVLMFLRYCASCAAHKKSTEMWSLGR